ncbi:MAG TPA: pyrimidine-nucleoside phosphorylase, partial [Terriglobia bacterium]|nr:pyrimidine-nucleoside phosphorylase [Terriglobia bacterium]
LVLDVKTGGGAFMSTFENACALARSIVDVGHSMKMKVIAVISDMEQPLGRAIGNAIEIRECVEFLNGNGPEDLETLSLALSAYMIHLGGGAKTFDAAHKLAYEAVSKGAALDRFREMVQQQRGDRRVIDNTKLLPRAKNVQEFRARKDGFVTRCDARLLGLASNALGAGRNRVEDTVDLAVGLYLSKKLGDPVKRGDVLCEIHWNDKNRFREALPLVEEAFEIKPGRPKSRPLIHAVLQN